MRNSTREDERKEEERVYSAQNVIKWKVRLYGPPGKVTLSWEYGYLLKPEPYVRIGVWKTAKSGQNTDCW